MRRTRSRSPKRALSDTQGSAAAVGRVVRQRLFGDSRSYAIASGVRRAALRLDGQEALNM